MKRILTASIFTVAILTGAYAQRVGNEQKITWGIKVETNFSGFIISETSYLTGFMKQGALTGGFVFVEFNEHFALQGEVMWYYKRSDLVRHDISGKYSSFGVGVPVYAVCQQKFGAGSRIYGGLGLYTDFGFDATLKRNGETIKPFEKDGETEVSAMKDVDTGFGIIAGYEFANGIQLNAGYKICATNILDANSSVLKMLPQSFAFGAGYRFGK